MRFAKYPISDAGLPISASEIVVMALCCERFCEVGPNEFECRFERVSLTSISFV